MIKKHLEWVDQDNCPWDLCVIFTDHAQERSFERIISYKTIQAAFEITADELYDILESYPVETEVLLRWKERHVSLAIIIMGYDEQYRLEIKTKTVINAFKKNAHDGDIVIDL